MAGFLDSLKIEDPATAQGLLQFGLSLLQSKGGLANALGAAGMQGLQGSQQFRDRANAQKRQGMLDQLTQQQIAAGKRQQAMQELPGQFMTGGMKPETMDNRDVGQPGEAPIPEKQFDAAGYGQALMGLDPQAGFQFQQMTRKSQPQLQAFKPGDAVGTQGPDGKWAEQFRVPDNKQSDDPLTKLIAARDALPPNHPNRRSYDAAISKMSTHAPPVSIANYGSPVPVALPDGTTGYVQPSNRPGAPPMAMVDPKTGKPFVKPGESKDKPLTESQAKAAVFKSQMESAEKELSSNPIDQTKIGNQFDVGMAATGGNFLSSPAAQRAKQAQAQWAESFLRFKTGAAATENEIKLNVRTFFPQPGDGKDVIAQKKRMRQQAVADLDMATGSGATKPAHQSAPTQVNFGDLK